MRKIILPLLASLAVATPAMANEARIEARGGVFWSDGYTQDAYGVAAGYDFDLGEKAFAGVEVSGDKIADSNTKVAYGFTGRLGAKVGEKGKLYGTGGYTTETCTACANESWNAGAGYQQGEPNYAAIQGWNAARVYQQAIAVLGARIDAAN